MLSNSITKAQPACLSPSNFFFSGQLDPAFDSTPRKIVGPYIQEGNTVIDMGCGPGYFTIDMAKMVGPKGRVIAVDIQAKMLARVRKKGPKTFSGRMDRFL